MPDQQISASTVARIWSPALLALGAAGLSAVVQSLVFEPETMGANLLWSLATAPSIVAWTIADFNAQRALTKHIAFAVPAAVIALACLRLVVSPSELGPQLGWIALASFAAHAAAA